MNSNFIEYCESIWRTWENKTIALSTYIRSEFQTEYLPEPYLKFNAGNNPLYIFTTNPGKGISVQHRDNINTHASVISSKMPYEDIASEMGDYYLKHLKGTAKTRISSIIELAHQAGYDGIVQIEACPFHSENLSKKNELLRHYKSDPLLSTYEKFVREALSEQSVVAVSAVGANTKISTESINNRSWLNWQANLIGFNSDIAKILPITQKDGKPTSALLYSEDVNCVKSFVLMMGGNYLPKSEHMKSATKALLRKRPV